MHKVFTFAHIHEAFRLYNTSSSASLIPTSLHAQKASDPELLRLGNGIAAIAEGQIITVEELRRELEPIILDLREAQRSRVLQIDELAKKCCKYD